MGTTTIIEGCACCTDDVPCENCWCNDVSLTLPERIRFTVTAPVNYLGASEDYCPRVGVETYDCPSAGADMSPSSTTSFNFDVVLVRGMGPSAEGCNCFYYELDASTMLRPVGTSGGTIAEYEMDAYECCKEFNEDFTSLIRTYCVTSERTYELYLYSITIFPCDEVTDYGDRIPCTPAFNMVLHVRVASFFSSCPDPNGQVILTDSGVPTTETFFEGTIDCSGATITLEIDDPTTGLYVIGVGV